MPTSYTNDRANLAPILNGDLVVVAYERERPVVCAGRAERVYTNATYTVYRMSGAK